MKIPKKLEIGGLTFSVVESEDKADSRTYGTMSMEHQEIWLRSDLPQQVKESTLLHEIIEAIVEMHELKVDHNVICSLEAGLYQVLKQNGLLK